MSWQIATTPPLGHRLRLQIGEMCWPIPLLQLKSMRKIKQDSRLTIGLQCLTSRRRYRRHQRHYQTESSLKTIRRAFLSKEYLRIRQKSSSTITRKKRNRSSQKRIWIRTTGIKSGINVSSHLPLKERVLASTTLQPTRWAWSAKQLELHQSRNLIQPRMWFQSTKKKRTKKKRTRLKSLRKKLKSLLRI